METRRQGIQLGAVLMLLWLVVAGTSCFGDNGPDTPDGNMAPVIDSSGVQASDSAPETGDSITLNVSATDPEGDPLTYSWDDGNAGAGDFVGTGSSVTWSAAAPGTYVISVTVSDSNGNSDTASTTVVVGSAGPNPPTINSLTIDPEHVHEGDTVTLTVDATDPQGETLTYAWEDDNPAAGEFSGSGASVTWSSDAVGDFEITCTVTNESALSASESLQVEVVEVHVQGPEIESLTVDPEHIHEGDEATLTVVATDPQGETLTYDWEDDNPAAGEFSGSGASVTWSSDTVGEFEITCTVTNESAESASDSIMVEVVEAHPAPADIDVMKVSDASEYYMGDAAGWNDVSSVAHIVSASSLGVQTTGNPSSGGHGDLGAENLVVIEMKAVHDGTNFAFRFEWEDDTENNTSSYWTYEGGEWNRSGNEDRLYMMFETGDPAATGRMDQTFSQVGCAMVCHGRFEGGNTAILDTTTELHDCSYCHLPAPGAQSPDFVHLETDLACDTCHEDRGGEPGELLNDADMISPSEDATFDVWHWKAGRSNPLGIVDDQYLPPALRRKDDGGGLNGTNSFDSASVGGAIPLYVFTDDRPDGSTSWLYQSEIAAMVAADELATWDEENGGGPGYYLSDGVTAFVPAEGATVQRNIHNDEDIVGDRTANTFADGSYSGGVWTVVVYRELAPGETDDDGNPTDKDFVPGENYTFSLAVTDNSGHNHKGKNLNTMHFEE